VLPTDSRFAMARIRATACVAPPGPCYASSSVSAAGRGFCGATSMPDDKGLLIVYTGPGKGKTTCALGTAFRAVDKACAC